MRGASEKQAVESRVFRFAAFWCSGLRTPCRDFKSSASAIPPPRAGQIKKNIMYGSWAHREPVGETTEEGLPCGAAHPRRGVLANFFDRQRPAGEVWDRFQFPSRPHAAVHTN